MLGVGLFILVIRPIGRLGRGAALSIQAGAGAAASIPAIVRQGWTGNRPNNELPEVLPQGGTDVPEDVYTPAPVPEEIASQYVVTVYDPKTMTYTTKTYPPR